ncbi:family 1 glycosylhydrolase [Neobacillus dielmonensis]|uniref:family 1 glycosylhydrolase n=1 Tax=Neobacillus dielmonensis TaxID=1347369 RepID=UPI00069433CC|nr:family 1 glycosylhydrolase [Neobacillus dielmonensis]
MVTEHGIATNDDSRRVEFIRKGLDGVLACLEEGLNIRGYLHWTTFDNFEWQSGYSMVFGLIEVDRLTQERKVKESGRYLGKIDQMNLLLADEVSTSPVLFLGAAKMKAKNIKLQREGILV